MRTPAELRERWLAEIPLMVTRPTMWARGDWALEAVVDRCLRDLCYLDGRDADGHDIDGHDAAAELRRYGKLGVRGPFAATFGQDGRYQAEIASVYAEVFHRLGYLTPARLLDAVEWTALIAGLPDRFDNRDVRRSEVLAEYGPASVVVEKRVLCYAPADGHGWVFVDCWAAPEQRYVPDAGRYQSTTDTDPLVRDVRHPADDFEAGLILTLYGRVLRWGPGWWIYHPDPRKPLSP